MRSRVVLKKLSFSNLFIVYVWTGENDAKTILVDVIFFKTGGKKVAFSNNIYIWPANRPFSQSETELLRAQLNKVGPKELCCRLGARPLNTCHVWPRSTAQQPDGIGWESILRREENRSTRRKTLGVRLRSTETQPTYDPSQSWTRVAEVGSSVDDH